MSNICLSVTGKTSLKSKDHLFNKVLQKNHIEVFFLGIMQVLVVPFSYPFNHLVCGSWWGRLPTRILLGSFVKIESKINKREEY